MKNETCIHCDRNPEDCERAECMHIPARMSAGVESRHLRNVIRRGLPALPVPEPQLAATDCGPEHSTKSTESGAATPAGSREPADPTEDRWYYNPSEALTPMPKALRSRAAETAAPPVSVHQAEASAQAPGAADGAPQWIAVSERLPSEADGTVIVLCLGGDILTAWATYWHGASDAFNCWTFPSIADEELKVTHWMPLPPPPAAIKEQA